jgi:hypothetical protein
MFAARMNSVQPRRSAAIQAVNSAGVPVSGSSLAVRRLQLARAEQGAGSGTLFPPGAKAMPACNQAMRVPMSTMQPGQDRDTC